MRLWLWWPTDQSDRRIREECGATEEGTRCAIVPVSFMSKSEHRMKYTWIRLCMWRRVLGEVAEEREWERKRGQSRSPEPHGSPAAPPIASAIQCPARAFIRNELECCGA